jgi:hypothetical protein
MNSIPPSIVILSFVFVVIPALVAIYLRWFCYQYLRGLNHDLSRLLNLLDSSIISDRLSGVITKLHYRYAAVSLKTDRDNTIALVEVVYAEQRIH